MNFGRMSSHPRTWLGERHRLSAWTHISSSTLIRPLPMGHNMQTSFSAYPGKQNNNTGESPQFNDTKFYGPVNIHYPQPQGYHGAPEGTVQMAYESLEKIFGNPLTATPDCLRRAAQALVLQKMSSDAKEHAQLIAATLQGEVRLFLLLPAPGPDHFTQLGPAFWELEGRQGLLLNSHQLHIILRKSVVRVLPNTQKSPPLHSILAEFTGQTKTLECNICGQNHKDWIAAPDMDIKISLRAWTKLLETKFESSRVPKSGFSRDAHRWRKWASETAELRVVNEPQGKDPPSNVEECERSMDLQARGLKSTGGGLYGLISIAEIQFLCWYTLRMCCVCLCDSSHGGW